MTRVESDERCETAAAGFLVFASANRRSAEFRPHSAFTSVHPRGDSTYTGRLPPPQTRYGKWHGPEPRNQENIMASL